MSEINSSSETVARTRSSWNFASVDILHSYIIGACLSAFPAIRLSKLGRQDKSNACLRPVCCGRSMGYSVKPETQRCRFSRKSNEIN
jgi:hypothetical protein